MFIDHKINTFLSFYLQQLMLNKSINNKIMLVVKVYRSSHHSHHSYHLH